MKHYIFGAILGTVIGLMVFPPPAVLPLPPAAFADTTTEHLYCVRGLGNLGVGWTPAKTTQNRRGYVIPAENPCPSWTIALVHNHPRGERCWYTFPGTYVGTSDGAAANASRYRWDGIWCRDHIVWHWRKH